MKNLVKYIKPYKLECMIAPSFKMLEALFELIVPLVMSAIIDRGIEKRDISLIWQKSVVLFLLAVVGLSCSLLAQYFAARAAVGTAKGLRGDLYQKIIGFSGENVDRLGTGSLITRITGDLTLVQNGVNMSLRLLLRSPFIVFGAMIMAFTIDVSAAMVFVVMIPILFAFVFFVTLKSIPMYKNIQKCMDKVTLKTKENLSGVRVVRAFRREKREMEEFDEQNGTMNQMSIATARFGALLNPVTLLVVNISMLILIYRGAFRVNIGTLTKGEVYALVNYMSQILVELVKFTNVMITINKALAGSSRIIDLLKTKNALEDLGTKDATKLPNSENIISFKDVSFDYPGTMDHFMEHVSFDVKCGETIGIIGSTGSGKTTLANLMLRTYDVTDGEILYRNTPIRELTLSSLKKVISIVPQKAKLFSGTLRDNLTLGVIDATDEELKEAVSLAVLDDVVLKKGEGLSMEIKEGGANLSGGQKSRITIARAFLKNAPILILDDASAALDYHTDSILRRNIKEHFSDATIFMISQRVVSVENADRILVMDDGKLVGFGTHQELIKGCDVYREICLSQGRREEIDA